MDRRVVLAIELAEASCGDATLTLRAAAEGLKISERHLAILFRACTGLTFRAYLRQIRLERGKDYLSNLDLSIKQVAGLAGYKSSSSFDRDFRKVYGIPPSFHREQLRANCEPAAVTEGPIRSGLTVWLTGLSSAGKSTIAQILRDRLCAMGRSVEWLDGDSVRKRISKGLGFSKHDRDENIRRIGYVAEALTRHGIIVLVSAISPYRVAREKVRHRIGNFLEVFVRAPLDICEQRDVKGIYRRARRGELRGVTGIDDPYEPPLNPDVECLTDREGPEQSASRVLQAIQLRLDRSLGAKP